MREEEGTSNRQREREREKDADTFSVHSGRKKCRKNGWASSRFPPKQIFLLFCNNFSFIINGGGAGKCEIATHTGFFFSIKTICPDTHTHTHADTHTGKRQRHKINYNGNAIKKESGERERVKGKRQRIG
jgi:hypothetical protein